MTPTTLAQSNALATTGSATFAASPRRITLVTQNRSIRVSIDEIVWLEGSGNYTYIHTRDKRRYLMAKTLKMFQKELTGTAFARIHKSHVVNLAHVRTIDLGANASVRLSGGRTLNIARRRLKPTLNEYLQHLRAASPMN